MTLAEDSSSELDRAAQILAESEGLVMMAGAGMGVDSGLPDFRGPTGFWKVYPALRGIPFEKMSTPFWFDSDPARAWGFFGHRLLMYRSASPHAGFGRLLAWGKERQGRFFVVTSNVDGQFQKAGFPEEQVLEVHGTIHQLQCGWHCTSELRDYSDWSPEVDEQALRCLSPLPTCPKCGRTARPNILMFNDSAWVTTRSDQQAERYDRWLKEQKSRRLAVIEIGAGKSVSTIRYMSQSLDLPVIRINPRDNAESTGVVPLRMSAGEALAALDQRLGSLEKR